MSQRSLLFAISVLSASAVAAVQVPHNYCQNFPDINVTKLIVMPNSSGHTDWTDAISHAKTSLHMTMYHITDPAVITALTNLVAKNKSVDLRVIVDNSSLQGGYGAAFKELQAGGVHIVASTAAFSLTHSKSMVVDGKTAFVTSINMTNTASNTRDFGIITPDPQIISELETVFETDWANAQNNTGNTPKVSDPNLAWSPVNANTQLITMINQANETIVAETETFQDPNVITALNNAVTRGVSVRLIVPQCVEGIGLYNYQYLPQLDGVSVQVEVDGASIQQPYLHAKMMVVDSETVYIGSINYTFNSIQADREVGIVFTNPTVATSMAEAFETDWSRSQTMAPSAPDCAAFSNIALEQRDLGM